MFIVIYISPQFVFRNGIRKTWREVRETVKALSQSIVRRKSLDGPPEYCYVAPIRFHYAEDDGKDASSYFISLPGGFGMNDKARPPQPM